METTTTIATPKLGNLAKALATAQAQITAAAKDKVNPHFKSKYSTLESAWDACRDPLAKNNIAVIQRPSADKNTVTVETLLAHESGESISSALTAEARDASPQAIGSAITYLRRYGLMAMVGIASEDDDGNSAQPATVNRVEYKKTGGNDL